MSRTLEKWLGVLLLILGAAEVIVAIFNLKHNALWLSVIGPSIITVINGWLLLDK